MLLENDFVSEFWTTDQIGFLPIGVGFRVEGLGFLLGG